jgi:hypothetical protein
VIAARPTTVGLELVAARSLLDAPVDVRLTLTPGDRALVGPGEDVVAGAPVAERLRDPRLEEVAGTPPAARPGGRWAGELGPGSLGLRRRGGEATGELLFDVGERWRIVTGEHHETLESPVGGTVRDVRPGVAIVIRAAGRGLSGVAALGGSTHGVLTLASGPDGEIRPGAVDVGAAGRILVVGSRVDAETITRARAMGVRGIVVAGLPGKERRDFLASEARQRASLHHGQPFGVLVLDGALRRPIASPVMAVLEAIDGLEAALVTDPPALVFDHPTVAIPLPDPSSIRVRSGPLAGGEGRWCGPAGPRRFGSGTHLEAGFVRFADGEPVALPLNDLERYA